MTAELIILFLASFAIVPLSWLLPRDVAMDGVALFSAIILGLLAPIALTWLAAAILITWYVARLLETAAGKALLLGLVTILLVGAYFILRELKGIALIGGAYFTLRALHVLFDTWMRRLPAPSFRDLCHYLCYLPVMAIGPINRFQTFNRSVERRRFDPQMLANGAERVLLGLAQATVLGGWLMPWMTAKLAYYVPDGFFDLWAASVMGWVSLYMVFAGFSSVAIGVSLMCGIKIEENFRMPFLATSLIDFWTRWHITLSFWCRDYVFQPVSVILRSPLIGLFAAMAAIGLWHETSFFYVLWAVWQTLGITLNRLGLNYWHKHNLPPMNTFVRYVIAPICVLGWLSLAHPIIEMILG